MLDCSGCCFADMSNDKQVSCIADKYKYLQKENSQKDNKFFELDRMCLYKRREDWKKDLSREEKINEAHDQLIPNIGFCIDDDSEDPNDLENLLNKFWNIDYPRNRIFVTIYSTYDKRGARVPKLLSGLRMNNIPLCSSVFKVSEDVFENETTVFQKMSDASFLTRISSNSNIEVQKCLDVINTKINRELGKFLMFRNNDALFINKLYVSQSYLSYKDYNKMQKDLLSKVIDTEFLYDIK